MLILAQLSAEAVEVIFWLIVIVVTASLLVAVALVVRRRMMNDDDAGGAEPFTLADLRRLHREGHLTDEEFQRAKAAMIAQTRQRLHEDAADDATEDDQEDSR